MSTKTRARILALLLASTAGCSSTNGSGTTGQIISLQTRAVVADDSLQPMINAFGWTITLNQALISVGPLYYYSGDPVLSQRHTRPGLLRNALARAGDWLVKPAFAHPGHYIEGAAMGEMLTPTTLDLLAGPRDLADGDGVTGQTNSARFSWQSPPQGELAPTIAGQVVLMRGTASRDGVTVLFTAKAAEHEVHDGNDRAEVAGCAFGSSPGQVGVEMDGNGTVTLTLVPSVWFDQVEFSYVTPGAQGAPNPDQDGVIDIAGTLAWQGFVRGLKKGTAYQFSYSK